VADEVEAELEGVRLSWQEREAKADLREEERLNLSTAMLITTQQTSKLYERELDEEEAFNRKFLAVERKKVKALNRLAKALEKQ